MDWAPGETLETLITQAQQTLVNVQITDYDVDERRALVTLEGQWGGYRIVISEIHRSDEAVRYTYYVLSEDNKHVHRFDNSGDRLAIKLKYGAEWKVHQHDANGNVTLTPAPMTFEAFVQWLTANLIK